MLLSFLFDCNWIITYYHVIVNSNYTIQSQMSSHSFIYQETACVAFPRTRICFQAVSAHNYDLGPMPSSPRGVRLLSGQVKRTWLYLWPTGRCGHRPLQKTCVFSVGGDALIAPLGTSPERSGKTDMAVPLATGRCGHRPLQRITCVFNVGGDAHIAPRVWHQSGPIKTNVPLPALFRSNESTGLYILQFEISRYCFPYNRIFFIFPLYE